MANDADIPIKALLALEYLVDSGALVCRANVGPGPARYGFVARPNAASSSRKLPAGEVPEIDHRVVGSLNSRDCLSRVDKSALEKALGLTTRAEIGLRARGEPVPDDVKVSPFAWYEEISQASPRGRQILEASRGRLTEWREHEEGREEVLVVLKRRRQPGVGALCEVLRATDKRVYVRVLNEGNIDNSTSVLAGNGDRYAAREDVMEGLDREAWRRLAKATLDRDDSRRSASQELERRLAPIKAQHASRLAQIDAAFEDALREAADVAAAPPAASPR